MTNRTRLLAIILFATFAVSCAAGSMIQRGEGRGYLRLDVEPASAEVEIDDKYSGIVEGWVDHVIPVVPGEKRVTLRAPGYLTQRFDIEVAAGEQVTLVLALEPDIELPPEPQNDREPLHRPRRSTIGAID